VLYLPPFSWNLFILFLAYITGILVSNIGWLSGSTGLILSGLFFILSMFFLRKKIFPVVLILLIILLGFLSFEVNKSKTEALDKFSDYRDVTIKGFVTSIPDKKDERLKLSLRLLNVEDEEVNAKLVISVYCGYTSSIEPGDYLILKGGFRKARGRMIFMAKSWKVTSRKFSVKRYLYRIKEYASNQVDILYPKAYAGFVKATILGETGKNIQGMRNKFQRLGLAHILPSQYTKKFSHRASCHVIL